MLASATAAYLLTLAHTYPLMLRAALGLGIAGGSFAVGVSYVSLCAAYRFWRAERFDRLWTSCFMLFLVHAAILRMERASVVATDRRLEQRVEVRTAT